MQNLIYLLPDEFLVLIIAGAGLLLMVRLISGGAAARIIGGVMLVSILIPLVPLILDALPWWFNLLLVLSALMWLLRTVSSFVLGARAADHMVGILAADVVRFVFWLLLVPFRMLRRFL